MTRRRRPHLRRQKRSMEFLWPFLVIILGGIIVVLLVQFIWSWVDQHQTDLKNKIYLYMDEGEAEILAWGQTEWTRAYHGQLVLEGDMLEMERASQGILEFYKGTRVRLDAESKLEIDEIITDGSMDEVHLNLQNGRVWLNVDEDYDSLMRFVVETDNLRVTSYGTIFEVGLTDRETVRVLDGEVLVEVVDDSSDREIVLEQITVGVGQQVEVTASDVEDMMARMPVSLLEAASDEWEASDWYAWNVAEDAHPTVYEVEDVVIADIEEGNVEDVEVDYTTEMDTMLSLEVVEEEEVVEESEEEEVDLMAPVVTVISPDSSPYTLEDGVTSISLYGTTSENTAKVVVTNYDEDGNAQPYTLQHYEAGSTEWRYGADWAYGNLREGRNLFTIVAVNGSDVESDPVEVIVEVPEGAFDELEEEDESEEGSEEEAAEEDSTEEEDSTTAEPLAAPGVTSLNGEALPSDGVYTTAEAEVTVMGTVPVDAENVYVNGYQLTSYVSGSGEWVYRARSDFNNYDIGSNSYEVYAEDADGNVGESFVFEIYQEAP